MLIENLRDFAVTVIIDQTVDFRDDLRFDLADFGNWERSLKRQRARGTARQPNMSRDAPTILIAGNWILVHENSFATMGSLCR